ncbi:DUF2577 domain-containing protein [Clostridium sp.]|uniref:DUF2577 domain-containing protein n=1 Tax=Clostridium sp. TaxID=1506 RepID=UPI00283FA86A|nr:DUF2577 domain-containing protein [Clostridium sp.]MDR3595095.1 DUF2577 domain-containing protein [Clostridium sp.]
MDPYAKIIHSMRRQGAKNNPPGIYIGTITSPPPNLVIQVDDMPLYKDDILIADYLLSGYSRQVTITGGEGTAIEATNSDLNEGDTVVLMPTIDMQTWILLCKAVSL